MLHRFCGGVEQGEELSAERDVPGSGAIGEQPEVTDLDEAMGQDVNQEAANELLGR